ncbi:UPF0585 protein C16orf13-like [Porphyridium purpureum]|uniref:UPF0585 protein C16orf13-like n=1 Tax=Porphyridium purpureum TaxID=35688 RepID=A0A5J4YW17_PORPP|nr:UPF0585 protein C16orf13-like [Porphyridium purpureum]|eukprot:POR4577..scf227_4
MLGFAFGGSASLIFAVRSSRARLPLRNLARDCVSMAADRAQHSPAAERNALPIRNELRRILKPASGSRPAIMLEIAAGTGQHAVLCSAELPGWVWVPTDPDETAVESIAAWRELEAAQDRVQMPIQLDVRQDPETWLAVGVPSPVDAFFCANMIHIAPWECCVALFKAASHHLREHGCLVTYGPYLEDVLHGIPTAPSNLAFDQSLKSRNPEWGIRKREDVEMVAQRAGLVLSERVQMPANNLLLVWRRA